MSLYRGWAITIRPRNGLTDDQITRFLGWVDGPRSGVIGCTAVTEMDGVCRHLHAAIYLSEGRRKDAVVRAMKRIQECIDPGEERVLGQGVKILYSPDFEQVYLTKNDDGFTVELRANAMTEEARTECLPSQAEQAAVVAAKSASDSFMHELAEEFQKTSVDASTQTVESFLHDKMFVQKNMRVTRNRRDRVALRDCLTGYLTGQKTNLW